MLTEDDGRQFEKGRIKAQAEMVASLVFVGLCGAIAIGALGLVIGVVALFTGRFDPR